MQNVQDPMGPIIATRPMVWLRADGAEIPAFVEIGMPYQLPPDVPGEPGDWACRVRTRGLGDNNFYTVYGVDGIQVLYLALSMAGTLVSNSIVAGDLDWSEVPNFGFPPPPEQPDGDEGCEGCPPSP
ncbi:DUF6968 family protein [Tautonia sociabilis]|uniref:DUF6968 domain-containing protein n=1 Tax=Tautonia sociabilis TaxID=2080755 RepID=A0A432ML98_9BACT|nr:hypothetical protein [Tautonia sociabilis]RUL88039.1 hypothetical protein TsocGM_08835 [Tautonia sociabilis]